MLSYLALLESSLSEMTDADYEEGRRYYQEVQPHLQRNWDDTVVESEKWPLNASELRALEREVLQKPEWLARWAYFDWRSFQVAQRYWYDRTRDAFVFSDVPQFGWQDGKVTPSRTQLTIFSNGQIKDNASQYSHLYATLPTAIEACMAVVRMAQPKLALMKGVYYIRFGKWDTKTEQSRNGLTKRMEDGISVYHVNYELDENRWAIDPSVDEAAINGTMQSLIYDKPYRPAFLVQGDEQERLGSDGEPLLKNVRLIKELHRHDFYVPGMFDPKEDDYDGEDMFENDTLTLPDLEVGDEVLVGKFKNRKATIKGFDTDKNNQPVLKTDKGEHKLFKPRISKLEENSQGRKLGHLCNVRLNYPEADFWIVRRGSPEEIGCVTKEFSPEHFGVKVTRTDVLLPQYLYYAMQNLCNQGYYRPHLNGALKLKHIGIETVKNIPLG